MSAEQKRLFERQMEAEAIGALDNTIFYYIVGDNGASVEGGPEGTYNELMALNGIIGNADQMMQYIDTWGGPTAGKSSR